MTKNIENSIKIGKNSTPMVELYKKLPKNNQKVYKMSLKIC